MARTAFHPAPYLDDGHRLLTGVLGPAGVAVGVPRVVQIQARPNRSVTVQFDVELDGRPTSLVVRAARTPLADLEPVATDADGHPICAFVGFDDPKLPGLRTATDPRAVARIIASLGLGRPDDPVELRVRAHRPLRRAVVEANGPSGRLFLKVVPPRRARELHRRHRLLTDAGLPVAPSAGWTEQGIVAIGAISGRTLREQLRGAGPQPRLADVHELLDRFPSEVTDLDGPVDPITRLPEHAESIGLVLPEARPRLERLVAELTELTGGDDAPSRRTGPVPVHGDLYEAQIMADGPRVRGLIDVDGIGRGYRIDDDANALGHLSVLDLVVDHDRARHLGAAWLTEVDRSHDPSESRARIGAVVVGLATGPFRVQERNWQRTTLDRLDLAEAWMASAQRARPRPRKETAA